MRPRDRERPPARRTGAALAYRRGTVHGRRVRHLAALLLVATVAAAPARAADGPPLALLEAAADALTGDLNPAYAARMTPFGHPGGAPLVLDKPSGAVGRAFLAPDRFVVIAYAPTTDGAQTAVDMQAMAGVPPGAIAAFADARAFARTVIAAAGSIGIGADRVGVTGLSLGGVLAEDVASRTGLGGASFAGAGLAGLPAAALPGARDFTSYVEAGDPFANWAGDANERALADPASRHWGRLVFLGPSPARSANAAVVRTFEAVRPDAPMPVLALEGQAARTQFFAAMTLYHQGAHYERDIASGLTDGDGGTAEAEPPDAGFRALVARLGLADPVRARLAAAALAGDPSAIRAVGAAVRRP